ncbi:hypothetical protein PG996_015541 [Apiospora saccharicola]|uniref:Uncharacterized protein n=1 Tax=Apiospora saccharicola TaxID=335842 RepID=A0ABR1TLH5_9PEZI
MKVTNIAVKVGISALIGSAPALAQETTSSSSVSTFTTFTSWTATTTSTPPTAEPTRWTKKCGADVCNSEFDAQSLICDP